MRKIEELLPEEVEALPGNRIQELVSAGVLLDAQVKVLAERLELYKARLRREAQMELDEREIALEGSTFEFQGAEIGQVACVSFPEAKVCSDFWMDPTGVAWTLKDKKAVRLGKLAADDYCGEHFESLFVKVFKPAKAFRELAVKLLGNVRAGKVLRAISFATGPRVSFKTAVAKVASATANAEDGEKMAA